MTMTYADEIELRAKILDPQYQQQLYMIEQAQRQAHPDSDTQSDIFPTDFDSQLLELIDSVPME